MIETRTAPVTVETRADGRTILSGHAAVFNSLSTDLGGFREQIRRGAFASAVRGDGDTVALHNHDTAAVLGRQSSRSLELREDQRGLAFDITLPNTSLGKDVAELVRRGDIAGMSFGFVVRDQDWEERDNGAIIRTLLKVDLLEVSTTAFPAYPATTVSARNKIAGERFTPLNTKLRLRRDFLRRTGKAA